MDLGVIDLDHTLGCGQVFRWRKEGELWSGVVDGRLVRLRQTGRRIAAETDLPEKRLRSYFRTDDDLETILRDISRDAYVRSLVERYPGLRLIRQDPWECSASYILATYSNLPRIKMMIERVCRTYGTEVGPGVHAFPTPWQIIEDQRGAETCGLGFRCARFVAFARQVHEGKVDFESLRTASYQEGHARLVALEGIGDKVADCIAVFSLDRLDAFPIDVRIKRALAERYGASGPYKKVSEFARQHFGRYCGYSQEYIYYAEDLQNKRASS
jgi:N-glycosylase/DNA lyase